jgi:hypothetical protein
LEIGSRRCAFRLLESWKLNGSLVNLANRSKLVTHGRAIVGLSKDLEGARDWEGRQATDDHCRVSKSWKVAL